MGSKSFPTTAEGYAQARQEIERINAQGGYAKSDKLGDIYAMTGN